MIKTANMQQTDHASPLFATAQKSGKARRLFFFVSHQTTIKTIS